MKDRMARGDSLEPHTEGGAMSIWTMVLILVLALLVGNLVLVHIAKKNKNGRS